jgi:hypothetical protein
MREIWSAARLVPYWSDLPPPSKDRLMDQGVIDSLCFKLLKKEFYMPRKSRRARQQDEQGEAFGLLALVVGSLLYTRLRDWAWQWKVALVLIVVSVVGLLIIYIVRYLRGRERRRLMLADASGLSPGDFELRIKELLITLGWERVQHRGGSGDGGVDIQGIYRGERCIVQCKRYSKRVEPKYIRDLEGARHHERADRAFLITTGYFTPQGYQWARNKPIELWDGTTLADRFEEQDRLERDPARIQRRRQRDFWLVGGLAAANVLAVLWAFVTAAPMPPAMTSQSEAFAEAPAIAAVELESVADQVSAPATCGQAEINGVDRLVLRLAPGLQTQKLADYPAGTIVMLLCSNTIEADGRVWQQVRVEDREGWMSKRYLK